MDMGRLAASFDNRIAASLAVAAGLLCPEGLTGAAASAASLGRAGPVNQTGRPQLGWFRRPRDKRLLCPLWVQAV